MFQKKERQSLKQQEKASDDMANEKCEPWREKN